MLPHRVCLEFNQWLMGLMILGDSLTAVSYFLIPVLLGLAQSEIKRYALASTPASWNRYLAFLLTKERPVGTMFQAFIYSCGAGHILKIWVLYSPHYWLQAIIDLWTGITSLATMILLFYVRRGAQAFMRGNA